MTKEMRS